MGNNTTELEQSYQSISPSDFFYRNREIAGFTNPSRAVYAALRELIENSLDACESFGAPPQILVRMREMGQTSNETSVYEVRIEDNGTGIPNEHIPRCFGQVFYGTKYNLKQARGTFGLGGTMTMLYGQITTHKPVHVCSSTGGKIYEYEIMVDVQSNTPLVLRHQELENKKKWRGTIVEFQIEGDYARAMPKVYEYLRQTAMINPYADITFIDPRGRLYVFERATDKMPPLPKVVKPHPHGIDVETVRRFIAMTKTKDLSQFMLTHFQGVRKGIVNQFLESAGLNPKKNPRDLKPDEIVQIARASMTFTDFVKPDSSCLSPIGTELFEMGILKEMGLDPTVDFVRVVKRDAAAYLGFPFVIEAAVAYGPTVEKMNKTGIQLYRFANRIPLLYDETSDVAWKVVTKNVNWSTYNVSADTPVIVAIHLCSTKIPYKTVGKECIADQPEIEKEITNAIREAARYLRTYISKRIRMTYERQRANIFMKYLPKIAEFSTKLAEKEKLPDIQPLVMKLAARLEEVPAIRTVRQVVGE